MIEILSTTLAIILTILEFTFVIGIFVPKVGKIVIKYYKKIARL